MEPISSALPCANPEAEVEEENLRFAKSLQELRGLQSQLRDAAYYCETTFLESKVKREVLENTKEYLCGAMVTVVDHLGNVSANLDSLISQTSAFSEAELRISCLKQRLLSCEEYANSLALSKMQWSDNLPRFHSRYLSPSSTCEGSRGEKLRDSGSEVPSKIKDMLLLEEEDLPLFMYTQKPNPNFKLTTATAKGHANLALDVVPVQDVLSVFTKIPNQTFHFQVTEKAGRHRKSLRNSDKLWLIRPRKHSQ
ncbi:protein ABIL2-like [Neltuma alba]|uniref:protein ABIL2-like n=1 Tax=Neltuma alba TaxID=207710 RepID=UPI0010A49FD6|nr:protein ABIL2-like [Prosopis alba]XP_028788477.1 protein ABIL2-like [Prosopis alba]